MSATTKGNLPYDFYSPFMEAAILVDPDDPNSRLPFWVNISDDQQQKIAASGGGDLAALCFCTGIELEIQLAHLPKIKVTLNPPYRDGINFLNSNLIEWGNSILEVRFGYSAGAPDGPVISPTFAGIILKPEVQVGQDISITLNAQGIGAFSATRQATHYNAIAKTREEIIRDLAHGTGNIKRDLEVDLDSIKANAPKPPQPPPPGVLGVLQSRSSSSFNAVVGGSDPAAQAAADQAAQEAKQLQDTLAKTYQVMCVDRVNFTPSGLSDWMAIWVLVREAGCWMMQQGNTLHIFSQEERITNRARWKYVLYDYPSGIIGPREGVFPILSASSPTSAVYMHTNAARGLFLAGIRSNDAKVWNSSVGEGTGETPRNNGDGHGTVPDNRGLPAGATKPTETPQESAIRKAEAVPEPTSPNDPAQGGEQTGEGGMSLFPSAGETPNAAQAQAQAEYNSVQQLMGIQLEVESLMNPEIMPGELIEIHGLGERLDANYTVFTHSITCGQGGFSSRMNCVSNTAKLGKRLAPSELSSPFNTTKPATEAEIYRADHPQDVECGTMGTTDSFGGRRFFELQPA